MEDYRKKQLVKIKKPVAVLFCAKDTNYLYQKNVDLWDEKRNAMLYQGPYPVIAHPPCSRWCQLAHMNEKHYGKKVGDDGGLFEFALNTVRKFGGVLEHPANSKAWHYHGLLRPAHSQSWIKADDFGYTCYVEQGLYGHLARKGTWLYVCKTDLVELDNRRMKKSFYSHHVGFCQNRINAGFTPILSKKDSNATPPEFAKLLLKIARSVYERH